MRKIKAIPEFHQIGTVSIENVGMLIRDGVLSEYHRDADIGLQVANDGRIWICINGIAFIRFSPHPDGRMYK